MHQALLAALLVLLTASAGCFGGAGGRGTDGDGGDSAGSTTATGTGAGTAGGGPRGSTGKGSATSTATKAPLADPVIAIEQAANAVTFTFIWGAVAEQAVWTFGDGFGSNLTAPTHTYSSRGNYTVGLRVLGPVGFGSASHVVAVTQVPFEPHVLVGVPDSGFNPYHELFRRPHRTAHPCTYIVDYPCSIPALNLTLDADSYADAMAADAGTWAAVQAGDRYWIPGTNIIGAVCSQPYQGSTVGSTDPLAGPDRCILGDSSDHGTGTSSSVVTENPDALLVVVEGNSGGVEMLLDGTFPIDIVSYSWGAAVPVFLPVGLSDHEPFYVAASGNEGAFPVVLDSAKAHPSVITVGAADGASRTEPGISGFKTMDFVSENCRPAAAFEAFTGTDDYCGTSFAAPTFAGALSRVVYELRQSSGYTGSVQDGFVDPVLGITKGHVRAALNLSASYAPDSPFPNQSEGVPLATAAPYYQWGWGYIARNEVPEVLDCLTKAVCGTKDAATTQYMQALWQARVATTSTGV